jgi:hypothetical protein
MYDPRSGKLTHISTCFSTHHLMFAEDANNTLWTSGGGSVVGWLNTKMFEATGDEEKSQGWTALILDTNGNGKRDDYVEPNQPVDPTKDKRYGSAFYAVSPAPDGSVWGSVLGFPGAIIRLSPGANPPATALAEVFEPPMKNGVPVEGYSPRGMDIDRNGVAWVALASGHMGSFDRRKCKGPLNGPNATGQHCPECWTFYTEPVPQLKNVNDSGSAEASYYTWVDQFDTSGLRRRRRSTPETRPRFYSRGRMASSSPPRAAPDRVLHEMDGRPHRRSESRLEGKGTVGHGWHACAVPHGDRQRDDQQGGSLPDASRSARQIGAYTDLGDQMRRLALLALALVCVCSGPAPQAQAPKPNILLIQADDLGYGDLSVYGQAMFQTPNVDRLARNGLRFISYYSGSTVCAPSRAALMTGLHTGHTWIRGNVAGMSLRDQDRTIAALLKDAGYRTALIGKWGLGESERQDGPIARGSVLVRLPVTDARAPAVHRSPLSERAARRGQPERLFERSLHARNDVVDREGRQPAVFHLSQLHGAARGASSARRLDGAVQGAFSGEALRQRGGGRKADGS